MQKMLPLVTTSLFLRPSVRTQHHRTTSANGSLEYVKALLPPAFVCCMVNYVFEKKIEYVDKRKKKEKRENEKARDE